MISCCHQSRLQTGIHGTFGKPQGSVTRVLIGQVSMSILTKLQSKQHVIEVLCRAKFKFCDHQKILTSKKWAFIKFNTGEFEDMVTENWLIPGACSVEYITNHDPLDKWQALSSGGLPLWYSPTHHHIMFSNIYKTNKQI